MKKSFKKDLLTKSIILLSISLTLSTFMFIFLHVKYMIKTNIKYLNQTSQSSQTLILKAIDSVRNSTDLLAKDLSTCQNSGNINNQKMIENLVCTNLFIKRAFITNSTGMQIAKYPNIGNINISNRDYFKKAMQGKGNFSPVITSKVTGESIIIYCTPIINNGNITGTVSSIFEINCLSELLISTTKDLNCTFGLLDNKGSLLLTNKESSILIDTKQKRKLNNKTIINLSELTPVKNLMNNKSGNGKFKLYNNTALVNYKSFTNSQLNLIIAMPYSSITNSIITYILIGILILIFILLISVLLVKRFTNKITNPITALSETLKELSQGNLNIHINDDIINTDNEFSELGKGFTNFSYKIKLIINQLQKNIKDLNDYSSKLYLMVDNNQDTQVSISNMMTNSNDKMHSNLNSLSENLTILEDFSKGIDNVAINLENLNNIVHISTIAAEQGASHANNTQNILNDSVDDLSTVTRKMKELSDISTKVNSLTEIINNIAKQTNLLALNAAIEASHAGEFGKGFSVVAEEIKKLAQLSSASSQDINKLLSNIKLEITSTSDIVNNMSGKFKNLVNDTSLTTNLMNEIKDKAITCQSSVEEIISIIEEQTAGIEESTSSLNKVVSYIYETVQSFECMDKKLKSQSESLSSLSNLSSSLTEMSNTIKENIDYFK